MTAAPAAAIASAIARPRPADAPVTRATRPSSRMSKSALGPLEAELAERRLVHLPAGGERPVARLQHHEVAGGLEVGDLASAEVAEVLALKVAVARAQLDERKDRLTPHLVRHSHDLSHLDRLDLALEEHLDLDLGDVLPPGLDHSLFT